MKESGCSLLLWKKLAKPVYGISLIMGELSANRISQSTLF